MKIKVVQLVVFFLALISQGCSTKVMFYHNEVEVAQDEAGVYTELKLNDDGTFEEYLYYSIGDSIEEIDYGTIINGSYTYQQDTLYLVYQTTENDSRELPTLIKGKYHEAYIKRKGELVKLQPVTYSSHFVNLILKKGKAKQLRSRSNYDQIIWKDN